MKSHWSIGPGKRINGNMRNRVKKIILRRILILPDKRLWIKMIIRRKEINANGNPVIREGF